MDKLTRFQDAPPSLMKRHGVTITRTFWLSKYKVTKEIWNSYQKTEITDYDKAMGGMKMPQQGISYVDAMMFCDWLTKRVRARLPNGYVVRLPTEAEWEYALFVKDMKPDSLYFNWEANVSQITFTGRELRALAKSRNLDIGGADMYDFKGVEVGLKKPNGLGLFDMLGNGMEMMLDTFDGDLFTINGTILDQKNKGQKAILYQDKEIDPLRCSINGDAQSLHRGTYWTRWDPHPYAKYGMNIDFRWDRHSFRLCIGPDLMKEKGYKFKLQKKR